MVLVETLWGRGSVSVHFGSPEKKEENESYMSIKEPEGLYLISSCKTLWCLAWCYNYKD